MDRIDDAATIDAQAARLLRHWIGLAASPDRQDWLDMQRDRVRAGGARDLAMAIALAPRRLGHAALTLDAMAHAQAHAARPGWDVTGLRVDQAARILVLLDAARHTNDFPTLFAAVCATADMEEAIALYRGLPLYPQPEALDWQVGEGLRTSMPAVFAAIAQRSPFPAERFSEERWNHMVLKALFLDVALDPIQRFDERRNRDLADMAWRYAAERRAAGRPVPADLWRCVEPFTDLAPPESR